MLTYAKKIIFLFLIPLCIVASNGCPIDPRHRKNRRQPDNISQDQGVSKDNSSRPDHPQNSNKKIIVPKKNNSANEEKPKNNTKPGSDINPVKNNQSNQRDIAEEYNKAIDNEYERKKDNQIIKDDQIIKTEKNKKWPKKIFEKVGELGNQFFEAIGWKKTVKKSPEMDNGAAPAA